MTVSLNDDGTIPSISDRLNMVVKTGAISIKQSFNTVVGIGSNRHVLSGDRLIILMTLSTLTGSNSKTSTDGQV